MKKFSLIVAVLFTAQFARAQWEDDFRLTDTYDTSYLNYGKTHSIATNGDTLHMVWFEKIDDNWEIFYIRSTDGGYNWEGEIRLTYTEEFSQYPSVSAYGSSVYIVWEEFIDGNWEIYFIRSTNSGEDWGEIMRLTEDPQRSYGSVLASSAANVYVAWVSNNIDQQTWKVYYKHSTNGGLSWSDETWLSPNSPDAFNVTIAVSSADVHVAWNDMRDGSLKIYYRKSSDNGMDWGPEARLSNDPAGAQMPSIAASGASVYVAWQDFRFSHSEIYCKGSINGGADWGEEVRVTYDPSASYIPNLALSNSVLHLVWTDLRNGVPDIFYNYSTDGGKTWATDTQLNDFSSSSQRPFIAVSDPVLHVVWQDYRDFNYEIYYKRNPTGGLVGMEDEPLSSSDGLLSVYPNPTSRQLTVDSRQFALRSSQSAVSGRRSAVSLCIVDLYGREIKGFVNISSFPFQIDIYDLRDGVYLLRVVDDEGKSGSAKFLKIAE